MNWYKFSEELKRQMNKAHIKSRELNLKIDRSNSYISQILNGKIKKVDYETSRKMFEELNVTSIEKIDNLLFELGIEVPKLVADKKIIIEGEIKSINVTEKEWLFKVGENLYIKKLSLMTLDQINSYLGKEKNKTGFIELANTLVNINLIEQICEAELYINGTIKI